MRRWTVVSWMLIVSTVLAWVLPVGGLASAHHQPTALGALGQAGESTGSDSLTGTERWRFSIGGEVVSSPAVVDGVVYVGSHDDNLYAVDTASGTERWRFPTGSPVYSSPTVVDGVVYVGSDDGDIYAVDAASGTERWRFPTGGEVGFSAAVVDGVVYVGSGDGHLYAVDTASGTERWRFPTGENVDSSPTVVDGVVYVGSGDGNLYAVDTASGNERWRFPTGSPVYSSPTVVDGVVYVGSRDGNLYAVDPPSPEAIATRQAEQAWDAYFTELNSALTTSPDIPAGFTMIEGGIASAPGSNPAPLDGVEYQLVGFALPSDATAINAVAVVRYETTADAEGAAATAASGFARAGWVETEVDGIEPDHTCLTLASASDARAVCYVNRDAFVLVAYSYLFTANIQAATTNATDLAIYANAVFDRVSRPAS